MIRWNGPFVVLIFFFMVLLKSKVFKLTRFSKWMVTNLRFLPGIFKALLKKKSNWSIQSTRMHEVKTTLFSQKQQRKSLQGGNQHGNNPHTQKYKMQKIENFLLFSVFFFFLHLLATLPLITKSPLPASGSSTIYLLYHTAYILSRTPHHNKKMQQSNPAGYERHVKHSIDK